MLFGRRSYLRELVTGRVRMRMVVVISLMNLIALTYMYEGVDGMHDEDIFEAEEVMDESNIYE